MQTMKPKPTIVGIMLISILLQACAPSSTDATLEPASTTMIPAQSPTGTNIAVPSVAPKATESIPVEDSASYFDDFSNSSSGWPIYEGPVSSIGYSDSGYRIFVNEIDYFSWSTIEGEFTDTRIEVEVLQLEGPLDAEAGIICRYQDDDNFYAVTYTAEGFYSIGMQLDGVYTFLLESGQYEQSPAIKQGKAGNRIRMECIKNSIRLFINDNKLAEVTATEFSSGEVGLLAGTFNDPGTMALFDDFTVFEP